MSENKREIVQLARMVDELSQLASQDSGAMAAVVCALAALVRTHPDPEAFSAAFRRAWLQFGGSAENESANEHATAGIASVLEVLEVNCPVRLEVRPPDQAADPEP